jgi:hypothetical protein
MQAMNLRRLMRATPRLGCQPRLGVICSWCCIRTKRTAMIVSRSKRSFRRLPHHDVPGIRLYAHPAGGWDAIRATARAIRAQMEAPEAIEPLLRTNKPDVFDCPGCAWPRSYAGVDVPILRERRQGRHLGSDLKTGDAGVLRGAHCQGASRLERPCAGG